MSNPTTTTTTISEAYLMERFEDLQNCGLLCCSASGSLSLWRQKVNVFLNQMKICRPNKTFDCIDEIQKKVALKSGSSVDDEMSGAELHNALQLMVLFEAKAPQLFQVVPSNIFSDFKWMFDLRIKTPDHQNQVFEELSKIYATNPPWQHEQIIAWLKAYVPKTRIVVDSDKDSDSDTELESIPCQAIPRPSTPFPVPASTPTPAPALAPAPVSVSPSKPAPQQNQPTPLSVFGFGVIPIHSFDTLTVSTAPATFLVHLSIASSINKPAVVNEAKRRKLDEMDSQQLAEIFHQRLFFVNEQIQTVNFLLSTLPMSCSSSNPGAVLVYHHLISALLVTEEYPFHQYTNDTKQQVYYGLGRILHRLGYYTASLDCFSKSQSFKSSATRIKANIYAALVCFDLAYELIDPAKTISANPYFIRCMRILDLVLAENNLIESLRYAAFAIRSMCLMHLNMREECAADIEQIAIMEQTPTKSVSKRINTLCGLIGRHWSIPNNATKLDIPAIEMLARGVLNPSNWHMTNFNASTITASTTSVSAFHCCSVIMESPELFSDEIYTMVQNFEPTIENYSHWLIPMIQTIKRLH